MNDLLRVREFMSDGVLCLDVGCESLDGRLMADSLEYIPLKGEKLLCALEEKCFASLDEVSQYVVSNVLKIAREHYRLPDAYFKDVKIGCIVIDVPITPIVSNSFMRAIKSGIAVLAVMVWICGAAETCDYDGVRYYFKHIHDGVAITNVTPRCAPTYWNLPDAIDGFDVTEISESACRLTNRMIKVTTGDPLYLRLPKKIKRIRARAFWGINRIHGISFGNRAVKEGFCEFPETLEVFDKSAFGHYCRNGNGLGSPFEYYWESSSRGVYSLSYRFIFWGLAPKFTNTDSQNWPNGVGVFGMHPNYGIVYVDCDECSAFNKQEDCGYYISLSGGKVYEGFSRVTGVINRVHDSRTEKWSVLLSCTDDDAKVFYTTDGSEPSANETSSCHLYTGDAIQLESPGYVKAIAYDQNLPYYKCETFACSDGTVASVEIAGASTFDKRGNPVALSCDTSDVLIRYTLDGAPVTEMSPVYAAPFAISDTTTVRAKAFKEDWFDSEEVVQTFTRLWYTNETPVIAAAAETFGAASQSVTLSCETDGATIYYTIDGSDPSATNGRVYKGPFDIYQTTTVKAIAVKDDWKDSAVASATFTKENAIGPALNLLEVLPDNDKTHPWEVVTDVTHDGVIAVKSGAIEDEESTTLKVVIYGAGRLSFWWRTSCEPSIDGEYYDFATFFNGSTEVARLAGASDWQQVTLDVVGTGKHTFKWTYQKDDSGSTVPDGVWLDQVQWLPQTDDYYSTHTLTTETPVPYAWLDAYGLGRLTDFETAAKAKLGKFDFAGRKLTVEEDYIAGTDPTNLTSIFAADIDMSTGLPKISWKPDLNEEGTKALRDYRIWGKESLDDGNDWEYPTNALHRFFKVTVEMK